MIRAHARECAKEPALELLGHAVQRYEMPAVAPAQLAEVREDIVEFVTFWRSRDLAPLASLCATELLTNVYQHVGGRCVLLLETTLQGVCITVSDTSSDLPTVRQPEWWSGSGRGMWLVSQTVDCWGARRTPSGKDVWAKFRSSRASS